MNRLVTFGDSYTHGIGLDGLSGKDHIYYTTPSEAVLKLRSASKYAWPELLAKTLGLECVNLGRGGCSPKFMFQMIREFEFHSTDIVVIQWPLISRITVWSDNIVDSHITVEKEITVSDYDRNEEYLRDYYTDFDALYNMAVLIENTYNDVKDKCKQLYTTSHDYPERHEISETFPILERELIPFFGAGILRAPRESLSPEMIQCNDGHPGKQYHIEFAEDMAERIKSKTL